MKKFKTILSFRIVLALVILSFVSCSKDSNEPDQSEILVTTSDFSTTIDENPANGQVIGTIQGSTNNGTVSFSITEQIPAGAFSIDYTSGELKVADGSLFNFETNPTITGTVKVANGLVVKNALVTITLNDLVEENIYQGNIQLKTQQEVIDFGANNYTRITGDLIIGDLNLNGQSTVTDLTPLNTITTVDLNLVVIRNIYLRFVDGLENLTAIGGDIRFSYNDVLENIEALTYPGRINHTLWISKNPKLINLKGLENVTSVKGDIKISHNDSMINLDGLENLTIADSNIDIEYNEALLNINALSNLTSITANYYCCGSLNINYNDSLNNIDGLSNLIHIGYSLKIIGNPLLANIDGLQSLSGTAEFSVEIGGNGITNVDGLQNFTGFNKYLYLSGNTSLLNLDGLSNVTFVMEGFDIINNPSLKDIDGLSNLQDVGISLSLKNNQSLLNINGLVNLREIEYSLTIIDNPLLENLDSLSNLISVEDLRIWENTTLSDFCGLRPLLLLNGVSGEYRIYDNAYNPTKQDIIDGNCSL